MKPTYILAVLASVAPATTAIASNFVVSSLTTIVWPKEAGKTNSVSFTVRDPDKTGKAQSVCSYTWAANTKPVVGQYIENGCKNKAFQFMLGTDTPDSGPPVTGFVNGGKFGLQVEHGYEDPSVGPPGMDFVDAFAKGQVNSTFVACTKQSSGATTCKSAAGKVLNIPVYAAVA